MGHGRTKPLSIVEAKADLLDWGRAADRAIGRRVASHRWMILGSAVAAGVLISLAASRREQSRPRGARERR
jgi:hypothetical protein